MQYFLPVPVRRCPASGPIYPLHWVRELPQHLLPLPVYDTSFLSAT